MNINIARAWKNALYRTTSSHKELTQLAKSPIGTLELTDSDLAIISGGCDGGYSSINTDINSGLGGNYGSYNSQPCNGGSNGIARFNGGSTYLPIQAPCQQSCYNPCN